MHEVDLILTLTGGLAAAWVLGYGTYRLGLSPIVGYLLAGFLVGPHTPGFIANQAVADQFAEVGVILLMFGVGLQFHLDELLRVWRVAVPGAVGQSLVAATLGCLVAVAAGWGWSAGIVFGLAISVASTVVLLRVLADNNDLHTRAGHIAVGWLVVEDLLTVLVLVLLPAVFAGDPGRGHVALALGWSVVKIALLLVFTFLAGGRIIPWLLEHMAATRSRELFTLTVLVLALGIAVGASKLFGVSMALGAFLAGMVVGRSDFSLRAASEALPMRDAFAVLFFVSVGMLFDPAYLVDSPVLVLATLGIVLLAKPLAALAIVLGLGYPLRVAIAAAIALAQIGEFSFILAGLGAQLGILPKSASNALVAAAIVSISLNPLVYRRKVFFESLALRHPRIARLVRASAESVAADWASPGDEPSGRDEAVVVGYGPVGRTLARLLGENGVEPTVIDLNLDTIRQLQAEGARAVYGDALQQEVLRQAGCERAVALVLTASTMDGRAEIIRLGRELNREIRVFAYTTYLADAKDLGVSGADAVFSGEGEVALSMTEFVLRELGATAEQIDRQRERIREELLVGDERTKGGSEPGLKTQDTGLEQRQGKEGGEKGKEEKKETE